MAEIEQWSQTRFLPRLVALRPVLSGKKKCTRGYTFETLEMHSAAEASHLLLMLKQTLLSSVHKNLGQLCARSEILIALSKVIDRLLDLLSKQHRILRKLEAILEVVMARGKTLRLGQFPFFDSKKPSTTGLIISCNVIAAECSRLRYRSEAIDAGKQIFNRRHESGTSMYLAVNMWHPYLSYFNGKDVST